MLDSFKEKVPLIMTASIGGNPLPHFDLPRPFSFQIGDSVSIHPKLAEFWVKAGIARPAGEISVSELISLKIVGAR